MEILHLGKYYPPEPGGMEYVLKSVAEATRGEMSHYCLVASRSGPSRVESSPGVTVHYLKERGTFLLAPVLPSLPFIVHRLRRAGRFPAILVHYPNPTALLALFLSLVFLAKREKIVVWCHADVLLDEWWKRAVYFLYRPVERFVLRRADAYVAATPHHVRHCATLAGVRDRTAVIPYAIPDDWFDVAESEREAAEAACRRIGGKFLLFVGRLVPYKGLDALLRAAGRIRCRIAVVGTGPLEGSLRHEVGRLGLNEKVLLLGGVDDLRPLYLGCEFLVLPSNSALEGFGVVQIEAMGLGKPVVSSDLPTGVTYVNRDGVTGLTFPVGDASAFAEACNRLLDDEALRIRLGESARKRTREEFSHSAMAAQAVAFFRRLCGDTPG